MDTVIGIKTRLMREYYRYFSKYAKGKVPEAPVAWVTAFTPVEILKALGILYYYPESYAAVIAASEKEQEYIKESEKRNLSADCCSYSCCFNGSLLLEEGPRGVPPEPDVLIATNNQCNTLPVWWNTLAEIYDVPLIILDYPGEGCDREEAFSYVKKQHEMLTGKMEALAGRKLDEEELLQLVNNSERSVKAWNGLISNLKTKDLSPTTLFDDINFLITARCNEDTAKLYDMMAGECETLEDADPLSIPVFWLGYPLWYHADRYLKELMEGLRISGSNYITWWSIDYSGEDVYEKLFNAYNYTFLNLLQESRDERLGKLIEESGAKGAIVLHNKSCKCDFVSARNVGLPQAELDTDMIDREYLNLEKARIQIELLKETICRG